MSLLSSTYFFSSGQKQYAEKKSKKHQMSLVQNCNQIVFSLSG